MIAEGRKEKHDSESLKTEGEDIDDADVAVGIDQIQEVQEGEESKAEVKQDNEQMAPVSEEPEADVAELQNVPETVEENA